MVTLDTTDDVLKMAGSLYKMLDDSLERLDLIDRYLAGDQRGPYTPPEANLEYRELAKKSVTNWLQLILSAPAQAMFVDGYRTSGSAENARPWAWWQANGMDARQAAVYRAAMGYGVCYVKVADAVDPMTGERTPQIRGVSPRQMIAAYDDPHADWPAAALHVVEDTTGRREFELMDDVRSWTVVGTKESMSTTWNWTVAAGQPHGAAVVPVVRFADMPDLEGRHPGMIEPLMPVQDRINQTAFDLLLTQTFAGWKVRTISGMTLLDEHDDQSDDADVLSAAQLREARAAKLRLGQDRMLVAEDPDTKFGTLDESPLSPFVEVQESNVQHLFALSQTPPTHILGQMANLSAEALVAAETSHSRKIGERQTQFGEAWEQTFRLAGQIAGDMESASDTAAEVSWRDHEARSFSATVDALGKAAQMLGIPARGLWDRVPGVTDQELERWERLASEDDSLGALNRFLEEQSGDVIDVA